MLAKDWDSKFLSRPLLVASVMAGALGGVAASAQILPQNPAFDRPSSPAVEKMHSLVGCWKGEGPHGTVRMYFDLVSDGTALVEYLRAETQPDTGTPQVTIYYMDRETPKAHHFCLFGSQILMKAESTHDPNSVRFEFEEATNLDMSRHEAHMTSVKYMFLDENHIVARWSSLDRGKEHVSEFKMTRVVEGCKDFEMTW